MKYLAEKYQLVVFKDIGRELARAIPSESGNTEAPLLFRFHHQYYTKEAHLSCACVVWLKLNLASERMWRLMLL